MMSDRSGRVGECAVDSDVCLYFFEPLYSSYFTVNVFYSLGLSWLNFCGINVALDI